MPTLVRFITVLVILAAVVFAGMIALVTFVHVTPRPMEQTVPPSQLK